MNSNYELLEKEEHRAEKQFCNGVVALLIGGSVIFFVIVLLLVSLWSTDHKLIPLAPEQISLGTQMMAAIFAAILATSIATANSQSPIETSAEVSAAEAQYHAVRLVINKKLQNLSLFLGMINVGIGGTLFVNLCWAYLRGDMKDTAAPEFIFTMLMISVLGFATAIATTAVHTPEAPSLIEARKASYAEKRKAKIDFLRNGITQQPGESDTNGQRLQSRLWSKVAQHWHKQGISDFLKRHLAVVPLAMLPIISVALRVPGLYSLFNAIPIKYIGIASTIVVAVHCHSVWSSRHAWERLCSSLNSDLDWFTNETRRIRNKRIPAVKVTLGTLIVFLVVTLILPDGSLPQAVCALLFLICLLVLLGCLSALAWSLVFQVQTGLIMAGNPGKIERFFINRMHVQQDETTEEEDKDTAENPAEEQDEGTIDSTGKTSSRKKCDTINRAQTTAIKILNISKSVGDKTDKKTILAEYEKDGDTVNFSAKFWAKVVSSI